MALLEKPDSDYCYDVRIFGNGEPKQCPDLDDGIVRKPMCTKYCRTLRWSVTGRINKCEECLENK